jgi:hypothetical protein
MRFTKPVMLAVIVSTGVSACSGLATLALNSMHLTTFKVDGTHLFMSGEINSKTLKQFEAIYAENPNIKTLVELDVPGSLDDETMIAFAYKIRELGINTHLTSKSEVYSGGVDLFLAGSSRTMELGAKVGVHSWSDGQLQAQDYPREAPEHEMNRKYIENMLGDDAFYWYTIQAAAADDIHLMSINEIKRYGLTTQ